MNERIRELTEQARKYARDYVAECKHYGHYMEHNEYDLRFEEKFAELIVRECATLANDCPSDYLLKPGCYPSTWIKKHFGVEE